MNKINITLLYFAVFREQKGRKSERMSINEQTTVSTLFTQLFGTDDQSIRYAVNEVFVESDTLLEEGDIVAFIPPLGGG